MSEGVRFCCRCDKPITQEHPGKSMVMISISVGGAVLWWHKKRCPERPRFVSRIPR
ncbi:hypothetical protein [Streptomyces sp. NPDC017988]|uniref:hypothetical protein n=1 Tax=Streptomyces sp. NPDC017988 TaxID=3365025 RepID=UPI0037B4D3E9